MMRLTNLRFIVPISAAIACIGLASAVPARAADAGDTGSMSSSSANSSAHSAQDRVNDALSLVQQMKQNPALAAVLHRAEGVFIIPHYGRGGFIVGGQGGGRGLGEPRQRVELACVL